MGSKFQSFTVAVLCCIRGMSGTAIAASPVATCASTRSAMVEHVGLDGHTSLTAAVEDLQVKKVRWDPVLRQSWTTLASCDHPERPALAQKISELTVDSLPLRQSDHTQEQRSRTILLLVRAGDFVRLWRQEQHLRIEVLAVSQESGELGSNVRVRLVKSNSAVEQPERQMIC